MTLLWIKTIPCWIRLNREEGTMRHFVWESVLDHLAWKCFPTEIKTDQIHYMLYSLSECRPKRYIKWPEYFHSKGSLERFQTVLLGVEAQGMWHFWKMTSLPKDWCPLTGMSLLLPTIRRGKSLGYKIIYTALLTKNSITIQPQSSNLKASSSIVKSGILEKQKSEEQ